MLLSMAHCGSIFRFSVPPEVDRSAFYAALRSHGVYCLEGKPCFLSTAHSKDELRHD